MWVCVGEKSLLWTYVYTYVLVLGFWSQEVCTCWSVSLDPICTSFCFWKCDFVFCKALLFKLVWHRWHVSHWNKIGTHSDFKFYGIRLSRVWVNAHSLGFMLWFIANVRRSKWACLRWVGEVDSIAGFISNCCAFLFTNRSHWVNPSCAYLTWRLKIVFGRFSCMSYVMLSSLLILIFSKVFVTCQFLIIVWHEIHYLPSNLWSWHDIYVA
jgi:hypothetical protein